MTARRTCVVVAALLALGCRAGVFSRRRPKRRAPKKKQPGITQPRASRRPPRNASSPHGCSSWNADRAAAAGGACGVADAALDACGVQAKLAAPTTQWAADRCRGWPMLERSLGVVARATNVTAACAARDAAKPCGFDVVDCAKTGRLGGVRVALAVSGAALDAAASERVDDDTIRVTWVPPVPGHYAARATFHFYYQDRAARPVDAFPEKGRPVFLGAVENRCPGGRPCADTRFRDDCDALALVPLAPLTFAAAAAAAAPPPATARCRGGGAGHWIRAASARDAALLTAGKADRVPWDFSRDGCSYHHFSADEAFACLRRRGARVLAFLGDSIVRDLYEAVAARLEVNIDVGAIKAVRFGGADAAAAAAARDAATATTHETRLHYEQIWGIDNLWRLGLIGDDALCCGFAPKKPRRVAGLDVDGLFGGAPGGEVVVVANWGLLHMPGSALNGRFGNWTRTALARLGAFAKDENATLRVVLLGAPSLLGLRNPGMHPDQLAAFATVMRTVAAEFADLDVSVLDVAPFSASRWDATYDGMHFGGTVTQLAVDALLGLFCDGAT